MPQDSYFSLGRAAGLQRCRMWLLAAVGAAWLGFAGEAQGEATDDAVSRYNEANELYRKGQFEAAARAYASLADAGIRNGGLYYNLGNALFKSGRLGSSILWYERARRLLPGDDDIEANLEFARSRKVDREEPEDLPPIIRSLTKAYRSSHPDGLLVICLVMISGMGAAGVLWLFRPERRAMCILFLALFGLGWVTSGALMAMRAHDLSQPEAVVLADEVLGRSGPGGDYVEVFTLHEGTKVSVERAEGGWILVRLPNGLGGWIFGDAAERI